MKLFDIQEEQIPVSLLDVPFLGEEILQSVQSPGQETLWCLECGHLGVKQTLTLMSRVPNVIVL